VRLCRLLGSRFSTDDAVVVARQKAGVGPFQFQIEMLADWWIIPLFPLDSQCSRLSDGHDNLYV
jgi:hypothetical protein